MRRTAEHLGAEATRIAAVANTLITTARAAGRQGDEADAWVGQDGLRLNIAADLDDIIEHARALRAVFAPEAPPAPAAPETNIEPRRGRHHIDERIVEAMQEIGSIVEHDEGVPYGTIARALITMGEITRRIGSAREQRLAGNIAIAQRFEREVEAMFTGLPEGVLWS